MKLLRCPVCGNVNFSLPLPDKNFPCPVAGCNGIVSIEHEKSGVRAWVKPAGGSLSWVHTAPKKNEDHDDHAVLLMRALEHERAEVVGIRDNTKVQGTLLIPEFWHNHRVIRIAPYALKGLAQMERLKLPDSLESIGVEACAQCTALESVEFGSELVLIDAFAFRDCRRLRELTITKPPECVMENAFAGCYALSDGERMKLYGG